MEGEDWVGAPHEREPGGRHDFKKEDEQLQNVGEALNTASLWFEKNQNLLEWILIGVIAVVAGVVALSHYVIKPKGLEAANENAKAEAYFLPQNTL